MYLLDKLRINPRESALIHRLLSFNDITDEEVFLQVIENGLTQILNHSMATDDAKEMIKNILTKTMSYRFDQEVEEFLSNPNYLDQIKETDS